MAIYGDNKHNYEDNRIEIGWATEIHNYLVDQVQRAKSKHYTTKQKFYEDLAEKQDMVIEYLERT